jgi:hypothetical protein
VSPVVLPVTPTTVYVNIEELPLTGVIEFVVNNVMNIPGVTVPDTDGLIDPKFKVTVLPDVRPVL